MKNALDPRRSCPRCSRSLDDQLAAAYPSRAVPDPGDLSVCFYCAALLVFEPGPDGMRLVAAGEDVELSLSNDQRTAIDRIQEQIRERRESGGRIVP